MSDSTVVSAAMQKVARKIDEELFRLVGHPVAFSLFVWTDGRANYISSADRSEVEPVIRAIVDGWSAGVPDIPAHELDS